jgi:hypothetical protein
VTATPSRERPGLRAAPWLLWFGVLGAGTAWSLHTLVDWGIEETVCRSGHDELLGVPVRLVVGVLTAVFIAAAAVSTAVSFRAWRRLDGAPADDDLQALRQTRASFMALVGFVGGLFFTLITVMGGIGVLVFSACAP